MSFFNWFKKKKVQDEPLQEEATTNEELDAAIRQKEIDLRNKQEAEEIVLEDYEPQIPIEDVEPEQPIILERSKEECMESLRESCEQILVCKKQNDNAKIEYQAVMEYMSDMQKIERMEDGEKRILQEAAKKVVSFTKEREAYRNREIYTSNSVFRGIRNYEGSLMEELKKMRESEKYNQLIRNDMRQLEAEKAALQYEYKELFGKQAELKKIAMATVAIVVSLFALFFVLAEGLQRSMTIPYLMTIAMAAGVGAYIFWEAYRNRYDHTLIGKKINRAINLLNKVKIKYINNTSALEYNYSKFCVQNSMEMEYLIKEYKKAKEAERTYQSNSERVEHYRQKIEDILQVHQVKDVEIWMYQVSALVNAKEFQDIKNNLEERKKRLTERMDYNLQVRDNCFQTMHQILQEKPEMREDVLAMLEQYHISF